MGRKKVIKCDTCRKSKIHCSHLNNKYVGTDQNILPEKRKRMASEAYMPEDFRNAKHKLPAKPQGKPEIQISISRPNKTTDISKLAHK